MQTETVCGWLVRRSHHQIGEGAVEALRVHARSLLAVVRATNPVFMARQCIMKIAFGQKADEAKSEKRCGNGFLYDWFRAQQRGE